MCQNSHIERDGSKFDFVKDLAPAILCQTWFCAQNDARLTATRLIESAFYVSSVMVVKAKP